MDPLPQNPYEPPQSDVLPPAWAVEEGELRPIPFEDLEALPAFWRRVGAMFQLLFRNPYEFYDRIPATQGVMAPWRFMILMCVPLVAIMLLVVGVFGFAMFSGLFGPGAPKGGPEKWLLPVVGIFYAVLVPIMQFIGLWVYGSATHLLLWVAGGTRQSAGLRQTIRATAYTTAFMTLGSLIPLLNYAVYFGGMVLLGIGLSRIHRTEMWRGILAAVLPPFLFCCCYMITIFGIIGMAGAFKK